MVYTQETYKYMKKILLLALPLLLVSCGTTSPKTEVAPVVSEEVAAVEQKPEVKPVENKPSLDTATTISKKPIPKEEPKKEEDITKELDGIIDEIVGK